MKKVQKYGKKPYDPKECRKGHKSQFVERDIQGKIWQYCSMCTEKWFVRQDGRKPGGRGY